MGGAVTEDAFYEWGLDLARRWLRYQAGSTAVVSAGDLLDEVWMRPAFLRTRRGWVLGADGYPRWEGSTPRASGYLRTALKRRYLDVVTRTREAAGLDDARVPESPPAPLPGDGCPARCLARLMAEEPERAWIFYVTYVSHARDPAELARETGLAPTSLHNTARRFRAQLAECVRRCEEAE